MGGVSNIRQRFELDCRDSIELACLDLETALIEQQRRIQRAFEA